MITYANTLTFSESMSGCQHMSTHALIFTFGSLLHILSPRTRTCASTLVRAHTQVVLHQVPHQWATLPWVDLLKLKAAWVSGFLKRANSREHDSSLTQMP